jgi:hypothetical protein
VTRRRLLLPAVAATVVVVAIAVALLLPMYTCMDPHEFEDIQGPGAGPTCIVSDTGYTPDNWVPTKVTVGAAGVVVAVAVVLLSGGTSRASPYTSVRGWRRWRGRRRSGPPRP